MLKLAPHPNRKLRSIRRTVKPTGVERKLDSDQLIVSKTDLKGRITYANTTFIRISGYSEGELIGAPHSILRHPDVPRAVFQFMWERIEQGHEVFAYVVNLCRNGDHYWVHAHITPSLSADGRIVGYHSNRRAPKPSAVRQVMELYGKLCAIENQHDSRRDAIAGSRQHLDDILQKAGMDYDAFIATL